MTFDLPVDVPDDVRAVYERIAAERGVDFDMCLGIDLQGVIAHYFDMVMGWHDGMAEEESD